MFTTVVMSLARKARFDILTLFKDELQFTLKRRFVCSNFQNAGRKSEIFKPSAAIDEKLNS
jgi:hypothetical protein